MEKHILIYVFSLVLMTLTFSCKKDAEVNKDTFKIENEAVEAGTQSVRIAGTYNYAGTIDAITVELGRQSDLMDADAYRTLMEGTDYSVEVSGLRTSTTYYYRYLVDYGGKTPYATETKSFATLDYNLPEVETKEVESVGVDRAAVSGEVKGDGGGDAVTLRGVCWSTRHNPSVGDEYSTAGEGGGAFTCELTNLQPEKTYYARAFAGNSKGIAYGSELTFVTLKAGELSEVRTVGIVGNAMLEATVEGEVVTEGASAVLERGVCYGKEHYPLMSGLHVASGSGTGGFACHLTNLDAGATYYVRAYAINGLGVSYGEEMSFKAVAEQTIPIVLTNMVSGISESSATGSGMVVADGGSAVTERGICWSTTPNPVIDDTHANCGNGVGEFSCLMPHLEDQTTYYVRAYAVNAIGLAYGEMVSFTVGQHGHPVPPTVITTEVMSISATTAVCEGNVIDDGGAEVTERGVCWGTSPDPTINGNHASNGAGIGSYTCMMTGLTPGTVYYVNAYAINGYGLSYGEQIEFTTELALPTILLQEVSGAMISYRVTDDGGAEVVEHGVCYSTSHNPTISDIHISGGSGTGSFVVELLDLQPGLTYYWRLYATNSVGTAYGEEYTFTTEVYLPSVMTFEVVDITPTTAIGGGEVTNDGGAAVTERGVCWGTSHNPTTSGSHASSGIGLGDFICGITDLTPNTLYYVRAYARNSAGTAYGNEMSFTTAPAVSGDEFRVDFENGIPEGWTIIDADGDGYNWVLGSTLMGAGYGYDGSEDCILSQSYANDAGSLYPDNYLVSPQVNLVNGSTFSFWACAQDTSYPFEHFGVFVSNNGTSDWTVIQEWTMTAKSGGNGVRSIGRDDNHRAQGNWYRYTVDLSAYAGQKYIAIRHFNCTDQFYLDVDDIELSNAKK